MDTPRKVKFVKQYTNHVGRVNRQYQLEPALPGRPLYESMVDVCTRATRDGAWIMGNAEAKTVATATLRTREADHERMGA